MLISDFIFSSLTKINLLYLGKFSYSSFVIYNSLKRFLQELTENLNVVILISTEIKIEKNGVK